MQFVSRGSETDLQINIWPLFVTKNCIFFSSFVNKTVKQKAILECSISQFEMSKHVSKSHIQSYFNHSLKNSKQILSIFAPLIIIQRIKPVKELVLCKTFSSIFLYYSLYQEKLKVITLSHLWVVTFVFSYALAIVLLLETCRVLWSDFKFNSRYRKIYSLHQENLATLRMHVYVS